MSISFDDTASPRNSLSFYSSSKEIVAQFVQECLEVLEGDHTSIITIEPEKSGVYFVGIVTTELLADTLRPICLDLLQTI